jgi:hypothetical protein
VIFCWQIQIVYKNGVEEFTPFIGTIEAADQRCGLMVANDLEKRISHITLHSEGYEPGTIATNDQIAADYQSEQVRGSVRWTKY